jgi:hypothetical protein
MATGGDLMPDKRAYFKVDVGYLTNPKIATLLEEKPRAILLHLQCIAYATQHFTDGEVPMRLAMRLACATQCDVDLLVQSDLLERLDDDRVLVHDYLEHQRSSAEVKQLSDKGKRAAEARWKDAPGNASGNASGMPNPMPREKEREKDKSRADALITNDFDEWYSTYPKKVGRPAALTKYKTARKKTNAETLLTGARLMAAAYATDKTYCPNPATWLHQERWNDEQQQQSPVEEKEWFQL